jgi:hypothetical protein
MSFKREMDKMVKALDKLGYHCERTGRDHWKVVIPGQVPVFMPASPSGWRSMRNAQSMLKKRGIIVKS